MSGTVFDAEKDEAAREQFDAMTDAHAQTIEQAFAKSETDADAALRTAKQTVAAINRYRSAARQGKVRELRAAGDAARQHIFALDQAVADLAASWTFDEEEYLRDGAFSAELREQARERGVRISELDGRLYCYPALIRVLPGDRAVLIDKAKERRLRPTVLVDLLEKRQRQPPRFRPEQFLESVATAYEIAVARKQGRSPGAVVPLAELYELLTLLPGQQRDYARQEFARDVYLLDQSGQTVTKGGARIEFHAGAGARLPRGTLSVVTQHGEEKKYHGISFAPSGA